MTATPEETPPPRDPGRSFWWAFALCSLLGLFPIWLFPYLPMVDLPQHAAQLAIWRGLDQPGSLFANTFEVERSATNLLAFLLAHWLSLALPIVVALKIVISLAIIAIPLVVLGLVRSLRGDPWWVFSSLPLGFGCAFGWGFVNYLFAVPLALVLIWLGAEYAGAPTARRAVVLFLLSILLLLTHSIAFLAGGVTAGVLVLARSRSLRAWLVRPLPLLLAAALGGGWLLWVRSSELQAHIRTRWQLGWHRFGDLPVDAVGARPRSLDLLLAALLVVVPLLLGARPSRAVWRWTPLLVALGLFFFMPSSVIGTFEVYQRFAVFVIPGWLFALEPGTAPRTGKAWRRWLAPAAAATFLLAFGLRCFGFHHETLGLREVLARTQPDRRLLSLMFERGSEFFDQPVLLHSGMWYQAERGGIADPSFARFYTSRFRYRRERLPPLPIDFEWRPELFDWSRNGGDRYDYFLVRSQRDLGRLVFRSAPRPIALVIHRGDWWLYRPLDDAEAAALEARGVPSAQ